MEAARREEGYRNVNGCEHMVWGGTVGDESSKYSPSAGRGQTRLGTVLVLGGLVADFVKLRKNRKQAAEVDSSPA